MKVAVSSTSGSLEAQVDPRFGRCPYFIIVDTETMEYEAIQNISAGAMSGAGIQAAQMVADKGVGAVITGNVGPNAFQVLSSAGIRIFIGAYGTVREAVERFKRGELQEALAPGPMGMGMGRGRGMGFGMGMGMGRGMWGYPGGPSPPPPRAPPLSREEEIARLEERVKNLQKQLEEVRKRLKELKET